MKYFDAFSGYGGFSLGIQKAYDNRKLLQGTSTAYIQDNSTNIEEGQDRATCIGFSEIDKYATQIYKKHFQTHKEYGDITQIHTQHLPDFDLLVGGFPCQAFSIAGKREGFGDTRGTLIYDVLRILKEKRPRFCLLENVKGLLSHDGGRTFKIIISALAELGYAVEWQVLNAKNFGVPQNRERVFIVGHFGGFCGRKVFPLGATNPKTLIEHTHKVSQGYRVYDPSGIVTTQASQAGGLGAKTGLYGFSRKTGLGKQKEVANSLQAGDYRGLNRNQEQNAVAVLTPDRIKKRQNGRRMKEDGDPMFTLTGQDRHGVFDGYRIRRLTPMECERLMGLPDGWTEGVSDSQRYKLCGNGVVVNVVEEIIKKLYGK